MKLVNDQSCAWIKDLPKRTNIKILKENFTELTNEIVECGKL